MKSPKALSANTPRCSDVSKHRKRPLHPERTESSEAGPKWGQRVSRICEHCGKTFEASLKKLNQRAVRFCKRKCYEDNRGHGHTNRNSPEYRTWCSMKHRCHNPEADGYAGYGGRGIKVCDRWRYSFKYFLNDMGKRPDGTSIERLDNNKGYEPGNCVWGTPFQQGQNRRNTRLMTHNGRTQTASQWSRESGISVSVLYHRNERGLDLLMPVEVQNRSISFQGKTMRISEWAKTIGLNASTIRVRLRNGWSVEDALNPHGKPIQRRYLTLNGVTKKICQWQKCLGFKKGIITGRLHRGWSAEKALTTPPRRNNHCFRKMITFQGKTQIAKQWSTEYGIGYHALLKRIKSGWSTEDALTKPTQGKK